jgi:hypothetical protein
MKTIEKLALVATLVIGSSATLGQEATTATDPTTTGSVSNYASLVSTVETGSIPDLTTFTASSTIDCVKVSTLQESTPENVGALETAVKAAQEKLAALRTEISGNTALLDKIKTSCGMPDLDVDTVVTLQGGEGGQFTVYVDDRA